MRVSSICVALLIVIVICSGFFHRTLPVYAQSEPQEKGWLEGTVHDDDGRALGFNSVYIYRNNEQVANGGIDISMNGTYVIKELKPGVYEVRLGRGGGNPKARPLRIWGVVIKPGVRSILNLTCHDGDTVEEIGQPEVATQPVLIISAELARLQQQIDELKKR